jgi:hypothetical protein
MHKGKERMKKHPTQLHEFAQLFRNETQFS